MNIENLCEHTYLRWEGQLARCVICGKPFPAMEYDPFFVGTFPRQEYKDKKIQEASEWMNSTSTLNMPINWRLDE
jgi:hypothetical protein